jgi:cysteine desulfurase
MTSIYLDNSATTKVREEVIAAMLPYLSEHCGNPSSIHGAGRRARQAVERARAQVAQLINAKPSEIYFSSGGTLSNNTAILGRADFVEQRNLGKHLITISIEHSSSLSPAKQLRQRGWDVTILGVNQDGIVDLKELTKSIRPDTSIISVMWANNEIGSLQPVEQIAEIARARNIHFHCDAVQAAGRIPIDVKKVQVDTLSLSGHKFYAPKGIGVLYVRDGVRVNPLLHGGGQERGLFPGTESVANIVGIGEAAYQISKELQINASHLRDLQKLLAKRLTRYGSVRITGPRDLDKRLPGHLSIVITGARGAELVEEASARDVFISSVSACSSGGGSPSHVLKAIGLDDDEALGALRISAGRFNTESDVRRAADTIAELISARTINLGTVLHHIGHQHLNSFASFQ